MADFAMAAPNHLRVTLAYVDVTANLQQKSISWILFSYSDSNQYL